MAGGNAFSFAAVSVFRRFCFNDRFEKLRVFIAF